MQRFTKIVLTVLLASPLFSLASEEANQFGFSIPMQEKGAETFYINANLAGMEQVQFMVDTGSGYTTINEQSLTSLQQQGKAVFVKQLKGILADGTIKIVPVYRISTIRLGKECLLNDIEAAVFPGKTRQILGLSALKKAGPFIFSFQPPTLVLSHCDQA